MPAIEPHPSKFHETGLLKRAASSQDGRQTTLGLTQKGRATFRVLNTRSDRQAPTSWAASRRSRGGI